MKESERNERQKSNDEIRTNEGANEEMNRRCIDEGIKAKKIEEEHCCSFSCSC